MKKTLLVTAVSVIACLMGVSWVPSALSGQSQNQETTVSPRFIAYYFYTNKRCGPCRTIETYAQEAITMGFTDQIENGQFRWQALNVEEPENKHFIQDFRLYTKSVVVAEYKDGKPVRWENLDKVWKLYRDKQKYIDYVTSKTRAFMEQS